MARRVSGGDRFPLVVAARTSPLKRSPDGPIAAFGEEKAHNLRLAAERIDGLVIAPGEVFSFCRSVGKTTRRRGYRPALELREGKLVAAVDGGLCQLANLLYLLALDLDVAVVERHHHSVDLFRDAGRTVPFGLGATVFYNYLDLRFRNTLPFPLRLGARVDPPLLVAEVRATRPLPFVVRLIETDHRFFRRGDAVYRTNRIWREIRPLTGSPLRLELLLVNESRVLYEAGDLVDAP